MGGAPSSTHRPSCAGKVLRIHAAPSRASCASPRSSPDGAQHLCVLKHHLIRGDERVELVLHAETRVEAAQWA